MQIFIPTRGRIFQETWSSITENQTWPDLKFVMPHGQMFARSNVLFTPPEINGIGPTRQWIIDNATDDKILMLDDDLVFATRREDEPTKFRPSTSEEIAGLFARIDGLLDRFAHVGVSTREGGNRDVSDLVTNTRLLRILAYRVDVLRSENVRFDRLELMEDFDVTLQLLRRGYPNIRINNIVHNQRSSNAPGGCSTYRTLEKQSQAATGLKGLHPQFVSVVTKKTKTAWNGQERQDVVIGWKRAFDSAKSVAVLDSGEKSDPIEEGEG